MSGRACCGLTPPVDHLQGQLLASVNNKLEALGLPRGTAPPPLSRPQEWLAAHRLSPSLPAYATSSVKASNAHSRSTEAPAWSKAADDTIITAMSIKAKTTVASPRSLGEAPMSKERWSGSHHSDASAVAGAQHSMQESDGDSKYTALQPVQHSGSAFWDDETPDSSMVEPKALSSRTQPLSPAPWTLAAEPDVLSPQPQAIRAQPQLLNPEHTCNAAMHADGSHLIAESQCEVESHFFPRASVPSATKAAGTLAMHLLSGLRSARTDKPKLDLNGSLQPARRNSTVLQGMDVDTFTKAAPVSRAAGVPDCSNSGSSSSISSRFDDSQHANTIVVASQRVINASSTSLSVSHDLGSMSHVVDMGPAAAVVGTDPALAAMQQGRAPAELLHSDGTSALDALYHEAGTECGVEGRMEGGVEGSNGGAVGAGVRESVARFQSRVDFQLEEKQASSTARLPPMSAEFSPRITGCDLEQQHSTVLSDSLTGRGSPCNTSCMHSTELPGFILVCLQHTHQA